MKFCKRIISIVLVTITLLSLICANGISVYADAPQGPIKDNGTNGIYIDIFSSVYKNYANIPDYGKWAYGPSGCAWFASARACELTGNSGTIYSGYTWWNSAYSYYGYTKGYTPAAKALACFANHVSVVERVDGNVLTISEGGVQGLSANSYCRIKTQTVTDFQNGTADFLGYVYLGVGDNVTPLPSASTLTVHAGTSAGYTSFAWTPTTDTDSYELWVKNPVDNSTIKYMGGLFNTQYQLQLPMGNYYAYIASIDHDRYEANSSPWWTYSNTVHFTVTDQAFAPKVSVRYGDSYYELYNITMPWSKAKIQCEAMGGHLATISSAEENSAIEAISYFGERYAYWIGMTDEITEGTWQTVTGEPINYVNWAEGQPNNQNNEDYAIVRAKEKSVWNDVPDRYANNPVGFICEYDYDPTYIRCATSEMYNDNRYEVYNVLMTWDDAKEYCESIGGHLVTISDKAESDFVNSLVDKGGVSAYWMGISDEDNEGTWTNITGEPLNYTNWEVGEPNNSGNCEHSCVIRYNDGHTWNDLAAKTLTSFICEFEADYKEPFTKPTTAPVTKPTTTPTTAPITVPDTDPAQSSTAPTIPVVTQPESNPVVIKPTTQPQSDPIVTKPTTQPDSNPTSIPVAPSGKMGMEAEVANQETGDILFTYSGVKNAYYYELTFYDFSGDELYTKSSETTEYTWTPEDNFYGYVKVTAKDNKGKTLEESNLYSYTLMDNEIQLAGSYGDADENFKINIKDATAVQKHLANIIKLSDFAVRLADVNSDNKTNIKDATTIQKHLANLKPKSRIGEMLTDSYVQQEIFLTEQTDSTDSTVSTDFTDPTESIPATSTEITEPVKPTIAIPTETTEATVAIVTTEATVATEATDGTNGDDLTADFLEIYTSEGNFRAIKVGEKITYSLELCAEEEVNAVQAFLKFDPLKLRACSVSCDNLKDEFAAPIINVTDEGYIYFNSSTSQSAFDFTEVKPLISVEFEATDSGKTEIYHEIEIMHTLYTDEYYFNNSQPQITEGITLTPVFKGENELSVTAGNASFGGKVGDTFTYYLELEADKHFEDIQGKITYDSSKLKLIKQQAQAAYCPILSKQVNSMTDYITNDSLTNEFRFIGNEIIDGFDFTEKRTLVMLEFEILAEGSTTINHTIEEMSVFGTEQMYFTNSQQIITEGISLTTSFE